MVKEGANIGSAIIVTPSVNDGINLLNQCLRGDRSLPTSPLTYLVFEVLNRFLSWVRIQFTIPLSDLDSESTRDYNSE
jgi:hypothetical protein